MGMKNAPQVMSLPDGSKIWENTFERFVATVYVPKTDPIADVINFGFISPYLAVLTPRKLSRDEAVIYAKEAGFEEVAKRFNSSVVFVYPTNEGGWAKADESLYVDLIKETRIHQYHKDGYIINKNRFTGEQEDFFIRGAKFRVYLYGYKESADYIAKYLLKTIQGEFLWGPGEITPAVVSLRQLSVLPDVQRRDIPIVSVSNTSEIDNILKEKCDKLLIKGNSDVVGEYEEFVGKYRRWCGNLETEPDYEKLNMEVVPGYEVVKTSPDNAGDDKGTKEHKVGYVAYYNKGLLDKWPVPTVLTFHGGGDSAMYIADTSGWYMIAHKYNILVISIENHLNSTATEMIELISKLKDRYNIDEKRLYASGFSMGGCKSWDIFQEYPNVFAGLAPMDATFELGLNVFGQPMQGELNKTVPVPVFYSGGEITPLPELPFQAEKCYDRIKYVFEVNKLKTKYDVKFEDRDNWADPIWGISGDKVEKINDDSRGSVLTLNYFESEDGVTRTCLASISGQGHECRPHTCEHAWQFISKFTK